MLQKNKKKKPRRKHVTKSHVFAVSRIAATKICYYWYLQVADGACAVCRVPCAVPPALSLSLKSKKGCDENGRRRRNDESREPGIRNDVPGILGPESIVQYVQYGRAGFSAFVFAFIFFCNNPIHKSWRKANYLTCFLRKKRSFVQ